MTNEVRRAARSTDGAVGGRIGAQEEVQDGDG